MLYKQNSLKSEKGWGEQEKDYFNFLKLLQKNYKKQRVCKEEYVKLIELYVVKNIE